MGAKLLLPDVRRILDGLERRIGILERRITPAGPAGLGPNDDIIYSFAGGLATGESPRAKLRYGGFLDSVAVALGTAGSTSTTFQVKQNGTVIGTVTVPSSSADYSAHIGVRVNAEDRISVNVTAVGTGAADLTVAARFT